MSNFNQEVLAKSQEVPVVVDFWAPWCGPCQFLGPVIEDLAKEAEGKWELAKINTDEHQDLSTQYGIRSIPAVKMFYKGEVIAEFTGALPKHHISKWLAEYLPDERKEILSAIQQKIKGGQRTQALEELNKFIETHTDLEEGKVLLASEIVFEAPDKVRELLSNIKIGSKFLDAVEDIRSLAQLMDCSTTGNPKIEEKIGATREALLAGNHEVALENLIDMVMIDKTYCDELPRKATIALFHLLGDQHELTRKYRKRFDMALY